MKRKSIIGFFALTLLTTGIASAQIAVPPPGLFQLPLNQVPVPEPPNLFEFVKNKPAAIRLGKALFWDMQAGSDGVQACASCHFHAGADNRVKNSVHPGADGAFQVRKPNETLQAADFPFHKRQDPDFQSSPLIHDFNDIVGSQGVVRTIFTGVNLGNAVDSGTLVSDPTFSFGGQNMRRVTGRNTPSVINAIFNFNNFWDGRAHFIFNGSNPFGPLDTNAGVWFNVNNALVKQKVAIELASLASQATGPPLDSTEMSFAGRTFPELGRKMLNLRPLGKQMVHPGDSLLGTLSRAETNPVNGKMTGLPGLNATYEQMIKDAFQDKFTSTIVTTNLNATVGGAPASIPFSQMEANFSLFWGLAIQMYEATLVSDQTPFDRFLGGEQAALTNEQQTGLNIFFGAGKCDICHAGTELTSASVAGSAFITNIDHALIDQMSVASGRTIIYDTGFNNTAVRRTTDDVGRGGNSPFTNPLTGQPTPLSFCDLAELQAEGNLPFTTLFLPNQLPATFPVSNDGAFKVPGLRNVELTAPYFHNGDSMTLEQTVEFYTRGGNFPAANSEDLDFNITQIGTMQNDPVKTAAMAAFMKSMTDERVRNHAAPFDHPELFIPNGDPNNPDPAALTRVPAREASGAIAPPIALTLDPLPTVTNKTSLQIGGTNETGATVEVSVNSGAPFQATVNSTKWNAQISGFSGGQNTITVTSRDAALNVVTLTAKLNIVFADGKFGGAVKTSVVDAIKALRIAVGILTPTDDDLLHGDVAPLVNGKPAPDNRIDVSDALLILKKAAELEDLE